MRVLHTVQLYAFTGSLLAAALALSGLTGLNAGEPSGSPSGLLEEEGTPDFADSSYQSRSEVSAAISDFIQSSNYATGPHALTLDNPGAADVLRILRSGNRIVLEFEVYEKVVAGVEQTTHHYNVQMAKPLYVTGVKTDALGETRLAQLKGILDAANMQYEELWFTNYGWGDELRAYYHAVHARFLTSDSTALNTLMDIVDNVLAFDWSETTAGYLSGPE